MPSLGPRRNADQRDAIARVKALTREHFRLPADAVVLAAENPCAIPGCPPRETIVAFWTGDEKRRHLRIFKPVAEVVAEDLPPWWMRDALAEEEIFGCPCC